MIQIYKHSQFVRSISKQGWKTNRCNEAYCHVFLYSIIIFCTPIAYIKEKKVELAKGVEHSIITNVGTNNLFTFNFMSRRKRTDEETAASTQQ